MGLGVGGTAVVLSDAHNAGAATLMVLVIWIAIAIVNGVFAKRD
jgi:hypothetical protein